MPTNLELKAKQENLIHAERIARRFGAKRRSTLVQVDTYFNITNGRLKLREMNGKQCELIYYHRKNHTGNRYSNYTIIPVQEPSAIKKLFTKLFGEKVVVRKKRLLYLFKNARIHLDQVNRLGYFIEFEVLVTKGKAQAESLMRTLREQFGISRTSVVAGSYSDLLFLQRKRPKR